MRTGLEKENGNAWYSRDWEWGVTIAAIWLDGDPAMGPAEVAWIEETATRLDPYSGGIYHVELGSDYNDLKEGELSRAFGPEGLARLRTLRARVDPTNLFVGNLLVSDGFYNIWARNEHIG